jgi:hypothetical protein
VNHRVDLLNLKEDFKLKQPHLAGGGVDQTAAAER